MIRRRPAIRITLACDACGTQDYIYTQPHHGLELPEGWASFPDPQYLVEDADPKVVLCPEHAHLAVTVRLVEGMLAAAARADERALPTRQEQHA